MGGCLASDKAFGIQLITNGKEGNGNEQTRDRKILEATNKSGDIVLLQFIQANEEMYMLGMYLVPDGNNKDQVRYINRKANSW